MPVWIAFRRLSDARPLTMGGPGFLSIEAVAAYCQLIDLADADLREEWLEMLQTMDQVWHEHQSESRAAKAKEQAEAKERAQRGSEE